MCKLNLILQSLYPSPAPSFPPPLVIHGHLIVIHAPGVGSLNIAWVGGEFEPVEYFLVI